MNRLNGVLLILILFLSGMTTGLYISPTRNTSYLNVDEYNELLNTMAVELTNYRLMLWNFYKDQYCQDSNFRLIDVSYNGIKFHGGYCDKNTVIILSDDLPPLPIFIMNVEEDND